MPDSNSKFREIQRLTSPLTFSNSKAMDIYGNPVTCVESTSEIRYIIEPEEGILSDDEVLQYAHDSKLASKIRLKRGFGDIGDVLLIHESLPWVLGIYYVTLLCITIPYTGNKAFLLIILVLVILPLIYMYRITKMNNHVNKIKTDKPADISHKVKVHTPVNMDNEGLASLKRYKQEVNNLQVLFDVKEEVVRGLIEKKFSPPQITYDKFISLVDSSHKLFYSQADAAANIINMAAEDTPRIESELENKIDNMKKIINQLEDLTNELVINISSHNGSEDEVKNLIDEMENLIESVKEY